MLSTNQAYQHDPQWLINHTDIISHDSHVTKMAINRFSESLGTAFPQFWELRPETSAVLPYCMVLCLSPIKVSAVTAEQSKMVILEVLWA